METCDAQPARDNKAWGLLVVAVLGEILGVLGLRYSEGFTAWTPTVGALLAFTCALYLVSRVMRVLPVSIAYPVWAGGGTAGVALLGMGVLGEPITPMRVGAIACVVLGVVLINRSGEKRSGC
jgi:small multidrug resistance pump